MSEQPTDYLISTCFDFGGRSVSVIVGHDGISYWLDESSAGQRFQQTGSDVIDVMIGHEKARGNYARIYDEHTIHVPVPETGLRVIREELSPRYWAEDYATDDLLDAILEPLFWEHVNQYLSPPCSRS